VRAGAGYLAIALGLLLLAPPAARSAGPPGIGPAWTDGVGTTAAALRAEVDPEGSAATYHFSYLTEAAHEANLAAGREGFAGAAKAPPGADPTIPAATAAVIVSAPLSSLSPETAYRYRVVVANGAATEVGAAHTFATEGFGGGPLLLDGRGWELVSPLDKGGGQIQGPGQIFGGGLVEAAAQGSAITYGSLSSFGSGGQGAPPASQYVSARGPGAWGTANITAPTLAGAYGDAPDGTPYQLFSPDLGRALMFDGRRCAEGGTCGSGYSLRQGNGAALASSPEAGDLRLAGADVGLRHVILSTCAALTADAREGAGGGGACEPNLYEWSEAGLRLINPLPGQAIGTPGAALAAPGGAVSEDGSRVYFTDEDEATHEVDLYLREGAQTKQVDEEVGGGGSFQTAAADGSVAFFLKAGHLYRYTAQAEAATDLTPGGGVVGVLGGSEDGDAVYYQDGAGLQLWRAGLGTVQVALGADAAAPSDFPPATGSARVSADGSHLAFLSAAPLTGYDNRDESTDHPYTEAYLFDAGTGSLTCASCDPTGERPLGPSTIPGAEADGTTPGSADSYKPRALSADGTRLFFDSEDALVLQDKEVANRPDVYEWEAPGVGGCSKAGGCVGLVSKGRRGAGSSFLDASSSGSDVFFLTDDSLVGADTGFADVYDAREGGGFPEPPRPLECAGDACQFLPSEPEDPSPATLTPSAGNGPVPYGKSTATRCKTGFVKRHGRCVRKPHKKHRHSRDAGR
jgi:hypothetical protein